MTRFNCLGRDVWILFSKTMGEQCGKDTSSTGIGKFGRIGDLIPRVEDLRLLTGRGHYTDDAVPSECSYVAFVRSPHAHARISKINTADALMLPGVIVMTGDDLEAAGVKPILNPADLLGAGFPSFSGDVVIPPVARACCWQGAPRGRGGGARGSAHGVRARARLPRRYRSITSR